MSCNGHCEQGRECTCDAVYSLCWMGDSAAYDRKKFIAKTSREKLNHLPNADRETDYLLPIIYTLIVVGILLSIALVMA